MKDGVCIDIWRQQNVIVDVHLLEDLSTKVPPFRFANLIEDKELVLVIECKVDIILDELSLYLMVSQLSVDIGLGYLIVLETSIFDVLKLNPMQYF